MYNSRPRKMNYDGYPQGFAVPENYSGNAFRENGEVDYTNEETMPFEEEELTEARGAEAETAEEEIAEAVGKIFEEKPKNNGTLLSRSGFGFNIGKLFGGGIGFEELLIIGLIFLIAQSENNEDIIVLLALLLFIG